MSLMDRYRASVASFARLPRAMHLILVIEFLSTLHNHMVGGVSYQLILNEYKMSELELASLQALTSPIRIVAGLVVAPLVDMYGVRRVAIVSLSLSVLTHALLAFGRSRLSLLVYLCVPAEAPLGLALFTVALKDLTTSRTRATAFALSTALLNTGIVLSLHLIEVLRAVDVHIGGVLFSGLRLSVVASNALIVVELALVVATVHDVRAVDAEDEPAGYRLVRKELDDGSHTPFSLLGTMRKWVALAHAQRFWTVVLFNCCLIGARNMWGQASTLMITFLTRTYGEGVPVYSIRSINPTINTVAPAVFAPFVAHLSTFGAVLPALWVFCASPAPMAIAPSVESAVAWMVFSGLGEAIWTPRTRAWTTEMAPVGQEGVFLTVVGLIPHIPALAVSIFNGWLNQRFVPNCRDCRDSIGHFCTQPHDLIDAPAGSAAHCSSPTGEQCSGLPQLPWSPGANTSHCPRSCAECPGWEAQPRTMFGIVLLMTISSPVAITLALPVLRAGHSLL